MPFALLIIGVLLLAAGVRNTQDTLFTTVKGDFTGQDNFIYWFVAMVIIGAIGYAPKLKPISTGLLALAILVLFLTKGKSSGAGGGFFQQFTTALGTTQASSTSNPFVGPQLPTQQQQNSVTQNLLNQLDPYVNGPMAPGGAQ